MRKVLLTLFLLTLTVVMSGQVTTLWEKSVTNSNLPAWFDTGNLTRGLDYGTIGGNERLLVVSRNGGNFIYVLDAATGDSLGYLDATGIAGGTYNVSDVAISEDGVVFVSNLAIGAEFRVYQYNDIAAPYSSVITADGTARRLGDKFSVTGRVDDNTVVIWAASASSNEVLKITTTDNGTSWNNEFLAIDATGGSASAGAMPDGSFYYNAGGINPKKYDASGVLAGTIDGTIVSTGSNAIQYITTKDNDDFFVTFAYGASNENGRIVKVIGGDPTQAELYDVTTSLYANANAGGTGDVAVKVNGDDTYNVFVLSTNNGLGCYKVELIDIQTLTIAEIQTTPDELAGPSPYVGATVKTTGIVTGKRNDGFYIQDGAGAWSGIWIYYTDDNVAVGDEVTVTGIVEEYFLFTELGNVSDLVINSNGNDLPEPYAATTAEYSDEKYESVLVAVENAECVNADLGNGEWMINDGSGDARVDDRLFAYTPVLGNVYNVTGIVHYSFDNFKLEPRDANDVVDVAVNPDPIEYETWWEKGAGAYSFFLNDNLTRSIDYNSTTGHLLVASRTGGTNIFVVDAATGDSLGAMDMTGISGGTYSMNIVSVDESGAVFLCNLALANGEFKLYKWTEENAVPVNIFAGTVTFRTGDVIKAVGSGMNSIIYASGSGSERIYVFTPTDESTYTMTKEITVAAGLARGGIAPVSADPNANIWVNGAGTAASLIDQSGTVLASIDGALMGGSFHNIGYTNLDGEDYIVVSGGNVEVSSPKAEVWNVTNTDNPYLYSFGMLTNTWMANANATAAAVFRTDGDRMIIHHMLSNNGIATYADGPYVPPVPEPDSLYTYWEFSQAAGNFPDYMSTDSYERGMAYGNVNGMDRVYVVSRTGGPHIVVHDAVTGQVVGEIPAPTPAVGYFPLNTIGVSEDGYIFACNMTLTANAAGPFTVYMWDAEDATPAVVVSNETANMRMGDKFSVYGRVDDNSVVLYAGMSGQPKFMKYTTTDNGATFTGEEITLQGATVGTSPMVAEVGDGTFYFKSYGKPMVHYNNDGSVIDTVSTTVLGTAVAAVKFVNDTDGGKYIVCTEPDEDGAGDGEYLYVVEVTDGAANAKRIAYSGQLGNVPNGNAGGACDHWKMDDDTHILFMLGTNNGIAAFSNKDITAPAILYAPTGLEAATVGTDVQLTWESGDPDTSISLSNFAATSGFYHAATKAYGSIYDLSGFSNPVVKKFDFAHGGFDFFEGPAKYIVYVYDMDAQTELYVSDTLTADIPLDAAVWERVSLPNISGVTTLGIFIESCTADSYGDVWPTIFTDDQVPPPVSGNVRIEDLTDPFNNITNPASEELGAFLINVYLDFDGLTGVSTPVVLSGTPTVEKQRNSKSFIFPAYSGNNNKAIGYNIYRGENAGVMTLIGSVDIMTNSYVDKDVADGIYYYGVSLVLDGNESPMNVITFVHSTVGVSEETGLPTDYAVYQNYPNPFNPATTIKFALPMESNVRIVIYNLLGEVVNEISNVNYQAGYHTVNFNASALASGIYFYSIDAAAVDGSKNFREVRKMMLLK